jgi:hypothetical protein
MPSRDQQMGRCNEAAEIGAITFSLILTIKDNGDTCLPPHL